MGARRYQPDIGRFNQRDQFTGALANLALGADPLTGNRYALAAGSPLSYVEVDGHIVTADGTGGSYETKTANRGVHIATHARRFRAGSSPEPRLQQRQPRRPATVGIPVVRKVDGSGSLSFAGHAYRVGNAY